ncbi:MAG: hypothetical protein RR471_13260 [Bacteroides sp.]
MEKFYQKTVMTLLIGSFLAACSSNKKNDYPADYVGFERAHQEYTYTKGVQEELFDIKIIAVEKSKEDRIVKISSGKTTTPGGEFVFMELTEEKVVIKAGKKSATTRIRFFPKHIFKGTFVQLTCTPQWKDKNAQPSKLNIQLIPK